MVLPVVGWICFIRRPACLSETFFLLRFFSLAVIVDVCMYNGRVSALLCLFDRVCVHPSPSAVRRIRIFFEMMVAWFFRFATRCCDRRPRRRADRPQRTRASSPFPPLRAC